MSALSNAFSLSAIAKNRLRMEWISVNVSELHRLDNGTILGVLRNEYRCNVQELVVVLKLSELFYVIWSINKSCGYYFEKCVTFDTDSAICCDEVRRAFRQHFVTLWIGVVNWSCDSFGCHHGTRCFAFAFASIAFDVSTHCSPRFAASGSFAICSDACQSLDYCGNTCNCQCFYTYLYQLLPVLIRCQCNQCRAIHPYRIHRHHLDRYLNRMHIRLDLNHRLECPFLFHKYSSRRIFPSIRWRWHPHHRYHSNLKPDCLTVPTTVCPISACESCSVKMTFGLAQFRSMNCFQIPRKYDFC